MRVPELRALLAAHMGTDEGGIRARRKDTLLQEVMKKEVEREIVARQSVLLAARHRRRTLMEALGRRGDNDTSFTSSSSRAMRVQESSTAVPENLTLLSFSEQVVMLHEATRLVQRVQGKALTGELVPDVGGLTVPLDTLHPADVIDGLAACIKARYETSKKYQTLFADLRDERRGRVHAHVDFDPDEGDMKILLVRVTRDGEYEYFEEKRDMVNRMLNRFRLDEQFVMERLLRAAITARYDRMHADWADAEGEVVEGKVLECRDEAALLHIEASGRDAVSAVAELDGANCTPGEVLKVGDELKVIVVGYRRLMAGDGIGNQYTRARETPHLVVSRSDPELVSGLLKLEASAFRDGVAEIFNVARVAGLATKVGVTILDDAQRDRASLRYAIVQALGKVGVEHLNGESVVPVFKSESIEDMIAEALSFTNRDELSVSYTATEGAGDCVGVAQVRVPSAEMRSKIMRHEGSALELASSLLGVHIHIRVAGEEEEEEDDIDPDEGAFDLAFDDDSITRDGYASSLGDALEPSDDRIGATAAAAAAGLFTASGPHLDTKTLSETDPELREFVEETLSDTEFRIPEGASSSSSAAVNLDIDFLDLAAAREDDDDFSIETTSAQDGGVSESDTHTRQVASKPDAHSLASMIDDVLGGGDADIWDDGNNMEPHGRTGDDETSAASDAHTGTGGGHQRGRDDRSSFSGQAGMNSFDISTDDMLDDLMFGLAEFDDEGLDGMSLKDELPLPMTEFSWDADTAPGATSSSSSSSSSSSQNTSSHGSATPHRNRNADAPRRQSRTGRRFNDDDDDADIGNFLDEGGLGSWQEGTEIRDSSPRTSRRTVFYHESGVNPETCAQKKDDKRSSPSRLQSDVERLRETWPSEQNSDRLMRRGLTEKPIYLKLGQLFFPHSAAAYSFFSSMLWETKIGYILSGDEMDAFVDLIERAHPNPEKKLGAEGLRHIYVGKTMKEVEGRMKPVRAFMLARKDGTEDDCSYRKLLATIYGRIEHEVEKKQLKKRGRMRMFDHDDGGQNSRYT